MTERVQVSAYVDADTKRRWKRIADENFEGLSHLVRESVSDKLDRVEADGDSTTSTGGAVNTDEIARAVQAELRPDLTGVERSIDAVGDDVTDLKASLDAGVTVNLERAIEDVLPTKPENWDERGLMVTDWAIPVREIEDRLVERGIEANTETIEEALNERVRLFDDVHARPSVDNSAQGQLRRYWRTR